MTYSKPVHTLLPAACRMPNELNMFSLSLHDSLNFKLERNYKHELNYKNVSAFERMKSNAASAEASAVAYAATCAAAFVAYCAAMN